MDPAFPLFYQCTTFSSFSLFFMSCSGAKMVLVWYSESRRYGHCILDCRSLFFTKLKSRELDKTKLMSFVPNHTSYLDINMLIYISIPIFHTMGKSGTESTSFQAFFSTEWIFRSTLKKSRVDSHRAFIIRACNDIDKKNQYHSLPGREQFITMVRWWEDLKTDPSAQQLKSRFR